MDILLYNEIYKLIENGLRRLNGYEFLIDKIIKHDISLLENIKKPPEYKIKRAIAPYHDIKFNMLIGNGWDAAEQLDYNAEEKPESYILAGRFKEFCESANKLSDDAMKILNKDIHNRIYTLLVNNCLK